MADTKKFTVTNTHSGPRVLNSVPVRVLQPGETVEDVEMTDAEHAIAKAGEWFEFGKAAAAKADEKPA